MGDTNRTALGIVEETTFGVIPTNPAFENLRVTDSSLKSTPKTVVSNEIRADGQVTDLVLVGVDAAGTVGQELSYGAIDTLIQAVMRSLWQTSPKILNVTADSNITDAGTTANTYAVASGGAAFKANMLCRASGFINAANNQVFSVASSTGTTVVGTALSLTAEAAPPAGAQLQVVGFAGASGDITATTVGGNALLSTTLDFTTLGLVPGLWCKLGGAATGDKFAGTPANNDVVRIKAIAAHRIDLDVVPIGWTTDAGTGKTIKVWTGDYIRNGTTEHFYTIERQYQDMAVPVYEYFRGMEVDELTFTLDSEKIITASATFMGKDAVLNKDGSNSPIRVTGATDIAAPTNDVMSCGSNVGRIGIGGVAVSGPNYVMTATLTIKRNLRARKAVGSLGSVSIGSGEVDVTGSLNTFFGDTTIYSAVLANTAASYDFKTARLDNNGQTIIFDTPKTKYSDGTPTPGAKNTDVMLPASLQALRHPTLGYTAHIQRFPYTEA